MKITNRKGVQYILRIIKIHFCILINKVITLKVVQLFWDTTHIVKIIFVCGYLPLQALRQTFFLADIMLREYKTPRAHSVRFFWKVIMAILMEF